MYMQSNEPFSRVDQGISPMTTGLVTGLVAGAASAGYQGLQYANYTGLEAGFDNLKGKLAAKEEALANTQQHKKPGMGIGRRVQDMGLAAQEFKTSAQVNRTQSSVEKLTNNQIGARLNQEHLQQGGALSRKSISEIEKYKEGGTGSQKLINQTQQLDAHRETLSGIQQKRSELRQPTEQKETRAYKNLNKEVQALQSSVDNYDLEGRKTSHHWHGKTKGNVARGAGIFAAGGFVVGGGLQMAVNSFNNA